MLSSIFLEKFQGFANGTPIELKPLTLIFGPNSSGKSSIIRSIRFAQQSFTSNPNLVANQMLPSGFSVDLGTYTTLVHRHDTSNTVKIGFEVSPSGAASSVTSLLVQFGPDLRATSLAYSGVLKSKNPDVEDSTFRLVFHSSNEAFRTSDEENEKNGPWYLEASSITELKRIDLFFLEESRSTLKPKKSLVRSSQKTTSGTRIETRVGKFDSFRTIEASLNDLSELGWRISGFRPSRKLPNFVRPKTEAGEPTDEQDLASIFEQIEKREFLQQGLNSVFEEFTGKVEALFSRGNLDYIGPLRSVPDRITFVTGAVRSQAPDAKDLAAALAANEGARRSISDWLLTATDQTYELEFLPMSGEASDIFGNAGALVLRDVKTDTKVAFADAGVGLSQILPILEKVAEVPQHWLEIEHSDIPAKTLLIEQPELHLHPKMQGDLMSLFTRRIQESSGKLQIIAETHSESMLLRLQSEIKRGTISASEVGVLYVDKDPLDGSTRAQQLEISPSGEFVQDWPTSFSEIRLSEIRGTF